MKSIKYFVILFISINFFACDNEADKQEVTTENHSNRIVSLSGFLTETLYDLGYGNEVVGIDVTSVYPQEVNQLPKLGHISQLNVEAILELKPTIIFVDKLEKMPEALSQLQDAGIKIVEIPTYFNFNNVVNAAEIIGQHIEVNPAKIEEIKTEIENDSLELAEILKQKETTPKTLFIYARGAGRLMIAGEHTSASAIIEKSGGSNAITGIDNFQALTPEALIEAQPEVILMFTSGLESLDGKNGLSQITGISETNAYKNNRIIAMDGGYLTSFSKRGVKAAIELAEQL